MKINVKQLNLRDIKRLAAQLEQRRKALETGGVEKCRAQVLKLIASHDLSPEDVLGPEGAKVVQTGQATRSARKSAGRAKKAKAASATGTKIAPKYQHPNNPELRWTGRGIKPAWVRDWLAGGGTMEALLIVKPTDSTTVNATPPTTTPAATEVAAAA
jgi:DNA-binding protein H-NS